MLHLHAQGIVSLSKWEEAKTCQSVYINLPVIGEEGPGALDQSRQHCCLKHVPIMGAIRISFLPPCHNVVFNPGSLPSLCETAESTGEVNAERRSISPA